MQSRKRRSPTVVPPTTSGPVPDKAPVLDAEHDAEHDAAPTGPTAAAPSQATAGPPPGGDPDAHAALVAALSAESPAFALSVFEEAADDRRAAVALAILEAFGPDEGQTIVTEGYDKLGEAVPDLSMADPLQEGDLDMLEAPTQDAAPGLSPAVEEAVAGWRPALAKVTDAVAFMSDASYNDAMTKGAEADTGFYGAALAELEGIRDAIDAVTLSTSITPFESEELCRLADVVSAWIHLYETLRDTGDRPRDRDALTEEVMAVVDLVQGKVDGLAIGVLGVETLTRMDASLNDVRTFVGAWSVMASDDASGASKPMWAAFLQTNQRYRMILNHYGLLEERGGEKARYNLAVRNMAGTIKTEEELQKESAEAGGFMVLAMETYSYKAGDHAKMLVQIEEILDRVYAGEFEEMQDAVQAARKHVGAGAASDNFYESLTAKIETAWMDVQAGTETAAGSQAMGDMVDADAKAHLSSEQMRGQVPGMVTKQFESHNQATDGMKERSEKAWQEYETYRGKAERYQAEAQAWLDKGDGYEQQAAEAFARAQAWLEKARSRMDDVDVERWPVLQDGLDRVEGSLDNTEKHLQTQEGLFEDAQELRERIRSEVNENQAFMETYDPEQVEVEVPDALKGMETKTYGRLSLSVDARIPGTPIKIGGSASTEFGLLQKGGSNWGYNKNDWSLRATLDLILIKITGAYVAGSYVEARDKLTPPEVIQAGEDERARYAAMKDIASKKPELRLAKAQQQGEMNMRKTFGSLKDEAKRYKRGRNSRTDWQYEVAMHAVEAKQAQQDLMVQTFSVFNDITDMTDAVALAMLFPEPDTVFTAVYELRDVAEEDAEAEVEEQRDSVLENNAEPIEETNKELATIADYSNDPDVYFEDYGGWEWGVEVGSGSYNASAKVRHVTVTSDGRGDEYDFDDKKVTTVTLGVNVKDYSGEVVLEWEDGELSKVGVSGSMVINEKAVDAKKRDELVQVGKSFDEAIRKGLLQGRGAAGKAIAQAVVSQFESAFEKPFASLTGDSPGFSRVGKSTLKIGYDWKPDGSSLSLGQGHVAEMDLKAGLFEVKATAEMGQEATFPL